MKPIIHYVGSKTKEIDYIIPHIPIHKVYCEPFCGSASLYFVLEQYDTTSILNDINKDITDIYQYIKLYNVNKLNNKYHSDTLSKERFNQLKQQNISVSSDFEQVYRTLYLFKNCYRNIHRYNKDGQFISAVRSPMYKSLGVTEEHHKLLQNATISNIDYYNCIQMVDDSDTFIYIDPPYIDTKMYNNNFTIEDYRQMRHLLDYCNSKWLVNIPDNKDIKELFSKYNISTYETQYNINKKSMTHLIIKNY